MLKSQITLSRDSFNLVATFGLTSVTKGHKHVYYGNGLVYARIFENQYVGLSGVVVKA